MMSRVARILLVEDNSADVRLVEEIFSDAGLHFQLQVARSSAQALSMLRQEGDHSNLDRPDIVLLDLNLPQTNGREVLQQLKQDPRLKRIPVIVLSASNAARDVAACYDLHANAYVTKPSDLEELIRLVESISVFWLQFVEPPPQL